VKLFNRLVTKFFNDVHNLFLTEITLDNGHWVEPDRRLSSTKWNVRILGSRRKRSCLLLDGTAEEPKEQPRVSLKFGKSN
jgi:hypothetical protein